VVAYANKVTLSGCFCRLSRCFWR